MTPPEIRTTINDRWVYFWGKYMVWSLRICCYCSNLYFFSVIRETFQAGTVNRYVLDCAIAGYSILGFMLSEHLFRSVYRPGFFSEKEASQVEELPDGAIVLTERDYEYRLLGEKYGLNAPPQFLSPSAGIGRAISLPSRVLICHIILFFYTLVR